MLEAIEYLEKDDGILVCRCYGEGAHLSLPERIADKPVTALADHVFAREPSFALRGTPKKMALAPDGISFVPAKGDGSIKDSQNRSPDEKAIAAESIERIDLPCTLRRIGNYAFYGCRNLKTFTLGAALEELGGGAFVASNHVRELIFVTETEHPWVPAIRLVLAEISYEVEVCVLDSRGRERYRLHFPEFYEDAVENTPARIFEMKFEGTGYKYRQCFKDGQPDLARYDSLFYEASVQEFPPTVFQMCCDRLLWPIQLERGPKEKYLQYLKKNIGRFASWCMEEGPGAGAFSGPDALQIMQYLCDEQFWDRETLQVCHDMAIDRNRADIVSLLQDYRRKHFTVSRVADRYSF